MSIFTPVNQKICKKFISLFAAVCAHSQAYRVLAGELLFQWRVIREGKYPRIASKHHRIKKGPAVCFNDSRTVFVRKCGVICLRSQSGGSPSIL